jgi:redox-sensitive bicupin YhaK (pirin superfamily)
MDKSIERVFHGAPHHWVGNGFNVSNYFPAALDTVKRMSPFFLLDYHTPRAYSPTRERRGVGSHPHRGFETVTIAYQGSVAHHDSAGNAGVIHPDEVQWMTAGAGILHNEYHEAEFARRGGVMHMAQIWVNLPRKAKMTAPRYQALERAAIPDLLLTKQGARVRVIAGRHGETPGAAKTHSDIHMLDVRLTAGGRVDLFSPKTHNATLLALDGRVRVNDSAPIEAPRAALFHHDGERVRVTAEADSVVLFLSGEPLEEPIAHYGPFVMNTPEEIHQAVADYNDGKFGRLTD